MASTSPTMTPKEARQRNSLLLMAGEERSSGATVVLAARDEQALIELASEIA